MIDQLTSYLETRFRTSDSWRILHRVLVTTAMPAALLLCSRTFEISKVFDGTAPVTQYVAGSLWFSGLLIQIYAAFALFKFERKEDKDMLGLKRRLDQASEGVALAESRARELSMLLQFSQSNTAQQAEALRRVLRRYDTGSSFPCKHVIQDLTNVDSVFQRTVSEIFHFFNRGHENDTVRVTLMIPKDDHLSFTNFYANAHNEPPRSKGEASIEARFIRNQSVAGVAWAQRRLVIVEDLSKEIERLLNGDFSMFRILHDGQYRGSMFSYPVEDRDETPDDPVIFVINVASDQSGRFALRDASIIDQVMKDFSDRLVLQFRLRLLSRLITERGD